ncbi:MAG: glycoside hydrolase family 15 protein [Pyrinomonadaceae bacterium]
MLILSYRENERIGRSPRTFLYYSLRLCGSAVLFALTALAQTTAPGGPGQDAQWLSAGKQAIGTSINPESKVWFTLANGVLTEVMYPNVQTANVQMLQFVVVNPKTKKVETEWDDAVHEVSSRPMSRSEKILTLPSETSVANVTLSEMYRKVSMPNSLVFRQTNRSSSGRWTISKEYLTDPKNNSVVFTVTFQSSDPEDELYVYFDPSIGNSGMKDTAWAEGRSLVSSDGDVAAALTCGRCTFADPTSGFFGVNDGLTQLRSGGTIAQKFSRAEDGNVVQVAKVNRVTIGRSSSPMVFALGFGKTSKEAVEISNASLAKGPLKIYQEYQSGWLSFLKTLPKVDPKYQAQFNMAAMVVKALEDKTTRGGNVASLSVPWGGGGNGNTGGTGYRMVWSRDLYHVFTAYLAIGDKAAAERALDFLFKVQQQPDGSFPQNSGLNGKDGWGSLQMDEVGYPLVMAWQLGRFDKDTWSHVKKSADFIVAKGPYSPQERWEERPGYSPSTIAAQIAGLVCAAEIAKRNGDNTSAELYLKTADNWAANVEKWTATTKGKYGDGNYYLRISEKGEPDGNHKIELNNNAGTFYEHEIVDAGFLELVRFGIKRADDPLIVKSLKVVDQLLKVDTPSGPAFYRYNNDGYGEMDDGRRWNWDRKYTGKGRPWPLLSGERGQYELALCTEMSSKITTAEFVCTESGQSRLNHMLAFASESLMLPEQIWDKKEAPPNADRRFMPELKFGEGTGSATPLAWSMGQFIRLATNLKAGRNLDTPQIVYDRYAGKK